MGVGRIVRFPPGAHADRDRLLADAEVRRRAHRALAVFVGQDLLRAADAQDGFIELHLHFGGDLHRRGFSARSLDSGLSRTFLLTAMTSGGTGWKRSRCSRGFSTLSTLRGR